MFLTYAHFKPEGTLFYIGKGSQKRAYAKDNRNQHWKNIVKKHGFKVETLATWEIESDALLHEKFLISCFKDLGYKLANATDGGEGMSGYKHTSEAKGKMSAFQKEFQNSDYMKTAHTIAGEKSKLPERRKKQSDFVRAYMADPINRERSKHGAIQQNQNTVFLMAQRERALKRMATPEFRYLMAKPCVCVETGQEFQSQADAAKWVGGRSQTINRVINGTRLTAYGYHWKLKD